MRLMFGGGPEDVYMFQDAEGDLHPGGGFQALFYDAATNGQQHSDLQTMTGQSIGFVLTSDGTDQRATGQIPPILGPDGVFEMWCSVNGSPRFLCQASNLGSYAGPLLAQLVQHLQASGNPHQTTFLSLDDVDAEAVTDAPEGSAIIKGPGGVLIAGDAIVGGGSGGDVTTTTDQTISGAKTFDTNEATKARITVRAKATGQTGTIFSSQSGTDTGQGGIRQEAFWLDTRGQARARPAKSDQVGFYVQAQPSQTANLEEWRDSGGAARAWIGPNFGVYAPNSGRTVTFTKAGAVATGTGAFRWYNETGTALTIRSVRVSVGTASTSGTPTVDVNVSGTTIYGTQANRPTVAVAGNTSGRNTGFSVSTIPDGGYLTADVDVAGTGTADLVVQVDLW